MLFFGDSKKRFLHHSLTVVVVMMMLLLVLTTTTTTGCAMAFVVFGSTTTKPTTRINPYVTLQPAVMLQVIGTVATLQPNPRIDSRLFAKKTVRDNFSSNTKERNNDDNVSKDKDTSSNSFFTSLLSPYDSKIPKEIEKEIYDAEANTKAAKDRTGRIVLYTGLAIVGIGLAFFNGFLSELRASEVPDGTLFELNTSPFAWVNGNFLTQFLLLNKLGGILCLLLGAGAGLLAEAEFDTRRINAEKIYQELVRRRTQKANRMTEQSSSKSQQQQRRKKKRKGARDSKRMGALAEVMMIKEDMTEKRVDNNNSIKSNVEESSPSTTKQTPPPPQSTNDVMDGQSSPTQVPSEGEESLVDSMKGFYNEANSMAAQQALLLNKKLEDAGVLEKITDETGMRVVVGKDEAVKTSNSSHSSNETDHGSDKSATPKT